MIHIDSRSRQPIYDQLVANIRSLVLSGALAADAPLPSVRQLSGQLGINPNTVQKAYAALEQQGVIYTVPGKGNFVRSDTEALRESRRAEGLESLASLARQLKSLGVPEAEAAACLARTYKEEQI